MKTRIETFLKNLPDWYIAVFFLMFTFILRAAWALFHYYSFPLPETNLYYELAQEIIAQGRILYDTSHPYYEFPGPLLPWLNALTMLFFGQNYLGLYLVTALGSALITFYTYKTARLFMNKTVSILSGIWSAIYLFYFYYTPAPGKDIWMAFFMIFLIHELLKMFMLKQFSWKRYLVFILMFVMSFHLDERFFIFSPFLFFYILYHETEKFKVFRWQKSLTLVLLTMLLMVPWTIRNYQKHEKIVLISTRTEAFTDKIFGYEPRGHMMDDYNDIFGVYYIHENQFDSIIKGFKTHTDGGFRIPDYQIDAMKNNHFPKPLTGFRAFSSRTLTMLEPLQLFPRYERTGYFYYMKSLRHNLATFLFYGLMFIFSVPGLVALFKKNRAISIVFISIVALWVVIHGLAIPYTNWRYRLPLDSIFIICGCLGVWETIKIAGICKFPSHKEK